MIRKLKIRDSEFLGFHKDYLAGVDGYGVKYAKVGGFHISAVLQCSRNMSKAEYLRTLEQAEIEKNIKRASAFDLK